MCLAIDIGSQLWNKYDFSQQSRIYHHILWKDYWKGILWDSSKLNPDRKNEVNRFFFFFFFLELNIRLNPWAPLSTFANEPTFLGSPAAVRAPGQRKGRKGSHRGWSQGGDSARVWATRLEKPREGPVLPAGGCVEVWVCLRTDPSQEVERESHWLILGAGILCPGLLFMSLHLHAQDPHKWLLQRF